MVPPMALCNSILVPSFCFSMFYLRRPNIIDPRAGAPARDSAAAEDLEERLLQLHQLAKATATCVSKGIKCRGSVGFWSYVTKRYLHKTPDCMYVILCVYIYVICDFMILCMHMNTSSFDPSSVPEGQVLSPPGCRFMESFASGFGPVSAWSSRVRPITPL